MNFPDVPIQYIGPKAIRTDNVTASGVVWLGTNDVQLVPHAYAAKLLAYPSVFVRYAPPAPEVESDAPAVGLRAAEVPADLADVQTDVAELQTEVADVQVDESGPAAGEPVRAVTDLETALRLLVEEADPEKLSASTGRPKVDAVRQLLGNPEISAEEVAQAWASLERN